MGAPTPCAETSLGDLLAHIDGLSLAFTAAATKTPLEGRSQSPSVDASRLVERWRPGIRDRLAALTTAWRTEAFWAVMTQAGGLEMPAGVAGRVALNEFIVHGWDIAVASGQPFTCEPHLVEAAYRFVQSTVAQYPHGRSGLFGPPVSVPDKAPLLDRLIGPHRRRYGARPGGTGWAFGSIARLACV